MGASLVPRNMGVNSTRSGQQQRQLRANRNRHSSLTRTCNEPVMLYPYRERERETGMKNKSDSGNAKRNKTGKKSKQAATQLASLFVLPSSTTTTSPTYSMCLVSLLLAPCVDLNAIEFQIDSMPDTARAQVRDPQAAASLPFCFFLSLLNLSKGQVFFPRRKMEISRKERTLADSCDDFTF